ncbi:MAG: HesA/MoeB/ThiF family protein [Leptospiraceae bacterium]
MLDSGELSRYSRNILLSGVGRAGQEALKSSSVLVIGAGGLGSPVLLYLAAAGVGRIRFLEFDDLDLTNLQRQVLYSSADVGSSKGEAARIRLQELNPSITVEHWARRFTASNAMEALQGMDLVLETTDSIPAKFLTNDACYFAGIPCLIGGILRYHGTIIAPGQHLQDRAMPMGRPCYRCLFPGPPSEDAVPTCAEAGVLGAMAGVVGSTMAAEALKMLLKAGTSLAGRLIQFEMLESRFRTISFAADPHCPLCGQSPSIQELRDEIQSIEGSFLDRLPSRSDL